MGLSTATYTFRQCLPRCRISAEFYENRAGERACFSSDILNVFLTLTFIWPRLVRVNCDMLLYFPKPPFLPTFYFCIAFLGYRLILSILSRGCQCRITHRVFHHSRPLGRVNHRFHHYASLMTETHDFSFSSLSSMTVWGLLMGLEGSLQTIVHFHSEHFSNTIPSSRSLG